ncbi:MAG: patatin-like phospholipase family protein [Leptospiraceae bacterium]|nr:patatin-like phospholipase family protein [Leptospiraceae bacterium]MCP5497054.1 patatin-like phospholipase family protein [Leptospiraceae bacterium]
MKKALILSGGGARGAYQAGVFQYLEEINFKPDIICGTSVGAINATAIGCGFNAKKLIDMWKKIETKHVMKYSLWKNLRNLIKKKFVPMVDTAPMRTLLESELNLQDLRENSVEVIISAVNIISAELEFFENEDITLEHVMASSAIPIFFPWQMINGLPYWDGGLMANTPILPAIERQAKEIVVVLLSPVGEVALDIPKTRRQALERMFELSLIGSYQNIMIDRYYKKSNRLKNKSILSFLNFLEDKENFHIRVIAPVDTLGLKSILNFNVIQADSLIRRGYEDAKFSFKS